MTGSQIDIEDAIEASGGKRALTPSERAKLWEREYGPNLKPKTKRIDHDLKGNVKVSQHGVDDTQPKKRAAKQKSPFQIKKERTHSRLSRIGKLIEQTYFRAITPGTPEHAELSVRRSMRIAEDIARKARKLKEIREPDKHYGGPTKEREQQAGEGPHQSVVYAGEVAIGINHRWQWPVSRAWQKHKLRPHHVVALNRFRTMFDANKNATTIQYGDRGAPSDPTKRNALTAKDQQRQTDGKPLASTEFEYIRKRLEPEFFLVIWVLVLERALPSMDCALSPVSFGRQYLDATTDQNARDACDQALKWLAVRLCTIYKVFDADEWYRSTPKELRADAALHTLQKTA